MPFTCSWNIETCRKSARTSSRPTLYHFKNVFLFLHMSTRSFRWNLSTGKLTTFTQYIEHRGKHSTVRNSAHRKPSTVFFNSSSGTTIAEAVNVQHINILGICEVVRQIAQHSVTINSYNGHLTFHADSHASYTGEVRREWRTIFGAKSVLLYSEIQGDQKVSVHLMITIQKVTNNVQSVPRHSPDIYWHAKLCSRRQCSV